MVGGPNYLLTGMILQVKGGEVTGHFHSFLVEARSWHVDPTLEQRKKPGRMLSIESWLINRDPYNGVL